MLVRLIMHIVASALYCAMYAAIWFFFSQPTLGSGALMTVAWLAAIGSCYLAGKVDDGTWETPGCGT